MASFPTLKMKADNGRHHARRAVPDWARRVGRKAGIIGIGRYRIPATAGGDGYVVKDNASTFADNTTTGYFFGLEQNFLGHDSGTDLPKFQSLHPLNRIWGWRVLAPNGTTVLLNWQWQTPHAGTGWIWEPTGFAGGAGTFTIEVAWQADVLNYPNNYGRFRYPFTDTRQAQEDEPAAESTPKKKKH
jgi:hypothetical protein